jgi:hypothetical protein
MTQGPILFHNIMRIHDGHLEDYRRAINNAVDFAERHGPQRMVEVFIDETHGLGHSFQLYDDSAAILRHWELSDPSIRDVMAHCSVQRLEVYGEVSRQVRDGLTGAGGGFEVTIIPAFTGFLR